MVNIKHMVKVKEQALLLYDTPLPCPGVLITYQVLLRLWVDNNALNIYQVCRLVFLYISYLYCTYHIYTICVPFFVAES